MRKSSSEKLNGNDQFEGYVVDLTKEISRILGFNYTFRLVPDGHYGSLNRVTNEWDGMVGELLEQVFRNVCNFWQSSSGGSRISCLMTIKKTRAKVSI